MIRKNIQKVLERFWEVLIVVAKSRGLLRPAVQAIEGGEQLGPSVSHHIQHGG